MNKDILQGNWSQLKGKIKQQWGKLTDDDVAEINGVHEQLQGKLQQLYGYQKDEAEKQIKVFLDQQNFKEKETTR